MAGHETYVLDGCALTPLASYLKALGILRLLSSPTNNANGDAADPRARAWWKDELFHLRTALSRDDLIHFFLEDYAPTPIIAPWNGRAGFLEGEEQETSTRTGADLMRRFESSQSPRFANMRRTIERVRANSEIVNLNSLRAKTKALQEDKAESSGRRERPKRQRGRTKKDEETGNVIQTVTSSRSSFNDGIRAYRIYRCLLCPLDRSNPDAAARVRRKRRQPRFRRQFRQGTGPLIQHP